MSSSCFQNVLVDYCGRHQFMVQLLMADHSSFAVDGNVVVQAHHFRRHIHGELYAAADPRQAGGNE
jgi:hypothetical protein